MKLIGMLDSLKFAKGLPANVTATLPKTKKGAPSFANRALFETLASDGANAATINWHFAGADAKATASWMRADAPGALLGDKDRLSETGALVSLAQLTLASHADNNKRCV